MENYLKILENRRNVSKFNIIYDSIIRDTNIYKHVQTGEISKELSLLLEDIDKPQYIICESSGKAILLEDAIFMDEQYLISEGIFDKVSQAVTKLLETITTGIQKVLSKSSEAIKAFIEKIKNNKVVVKIREKLGLDEKLSQDKFKKFFKIKKGVVKESVEHKNKHVISEATKLSKKEEEITDPKELQKYIKRYEEAVSGKKPIKNSKTGKELSVNYCKEKLRLLKKKLATLSNGDNNKDIDNKDTDKKTS